MALHEADIEMTQETSDGPQETGDRSAAKGRTRTKVRPMTREERAARRVEIAELVARKHAEMSGSGGVEIHVIKGYTGKGRAVKVPSLRGVTVKGNIAVNGITIENLPKGVDVVLVDNTTGEGASFQVKTPRKGVRISGLQGFGSVLDVTGDSWLETVGEIRRNGATIRSACDKVGRIMNQAVETIADEEGLVRGPRSAGKLRDKA